MSKGTTSFWENNWVIILSSLLYYKQWIKYYLHERISFKIWKHLKIFYYWKQLFLSC